MNNNEPQTELSSAERISGVSTEQLIKNAENAVIDAIMVPKEWLPESYRGKRKMRKLRSVVNESKRRNKSLWADPRSVSVKFDKNRQVTESTPERLAAIEKYRNQVESLGHVDDETEFEIEYDENENLLYDRRMKWAAAMVASGRIEADDLMKD